MIDQHFVILGAIIGVAGGLNYVINTVRGQTKPNRVTWFIWALAPLVAFAAEIKEGVGLLALTTFMAGFIPVLVLIASFLNRQSTWKLGAFDIACGLLSILGLILWLLSGHGNVAIAFGILADGLAALPTIVKSFSYPETESWLGYFTAAVSGVIAMLTIDHWTFAHYGFPLYFTVVCAILVLLIKFRLGLRLRPRPQT